MKYIRLFSTISSEDIALVGGKNASLGEMFNGLSKQDINVPDGFAITSDAYWDVIKHNKILEPLKKLIAETDVTNIQQLQSNARFARELITNAQIPEKIYSEIIHAYSDLKKKYGQELSVAVRSSATAEDLPTASFAGQHDTFLNISGEESLITAYKKCLASLFTDRAIVYRTDKNFNHFEVALSVCVMMMVRSDEAASGVMFTIDTESGFEDVVLINSILGLGEAIVQGIVTPDEFIIHKPTFRSGYRKILKRTLGAKLKKIIYSENGTNISEVSTNQNEQQNFSITDDDVLTLADYAIKTEEYYRKKNDNSMAVDIEWAKDSHDNKIYLIQARPETVIAHKNRNIFKQYILKETGPLIVSGYAAGTSIASGTARIIQSSDQLSEFKEGEVLVAEATMPDWGTILKKASAIVTNQGGRTCHAAIVARELGIPAVVGTHTSTEHINDGDLVTVSCAEGVTGKVYSGILPIQISEDDLSELADTQTKLMINLGNPEQAFKYSALPCDGIGLARMEFIINQYIDVHPMALINKELLKDHETVNKINELTKNYATPSQYFLEKLAEGIGVIAAAFYPRPVIVRTSDFKSNEYANLLGGNEFEPSENNPMLGLRGASRYTHPIYKQGFKLECQAIKYLREQAGFHNISMMIPFCRTVKEAESIVNVMREFELVRGKDGLKIYLMCEIPNNVILIDQFLEHFDGISIGSNDLTQLLLGVDRDSELVAFDFNEQDPGVLEMISRAVEGARKNNKYSGICGQAPSDYPDMAKFLIDIGIESISVNPDKLISFKAIVADIEKNISHT